MEHQPIYSKDREKPHESLIHLSDTEKLRIREITLRKIRKDYEKTLATFSDKEQTEKLRTLEGVSRDLSARLSQTSGFVFGELQQTILRLKLARHFQQNDIVDMNVLYDALIESPKFLLSDKGSLHYLFETHERKTIQNIAEIRRRKAEQTGEEGLNPFEWVYETEDGEYALARLLNMPHLEEESEYMNHCVGTSDSYVNKMKHGEVEIFSVRTAPKIDDVTGTLTEDEPVLTIEYNVKTGVIEQMKKYDDEYLSAEDPYYDDVIEILKELRNTKLDTGKPRTIRRIEKSETQHFPDPKPGHILTDTGEVSWEEFDPKSYALILKTSSVETDITTPKEILAKMFSVFGGLELQPEQIARSLEELSERTTIFVGSFELSTLQQLPETVHYYTSPDREPIRRFDQEAGGRTLEDMKFRMKLGGHKFLGEGEFMVDSDDFKRSIYTDETFTNLKPREKHKLIRLTVADLGFPNGAPYPKIMDRALELGLNLCSPSDALEYRISYTDQPMDEYVGIGMNPISGHDRDPRVFGVFRFGGGSLLNGSWASPGDHWGADDEIVFRLKQATSFANDVASEIL